eukprot:6240862-Prymnesium_polylepis.1
MGGVCGQGEVGWRRRTDRPPDTPRGRAPDAPQTTQPDVRSGCCTLGIDALQMWNDSVMHKGHLRSSWNPLEPSS